MLLSVSSVGFVPPFSCIPQILRYLRLGPVPLSDLILQLRFSVIGFNFGQNPSLLFIELSDLLRLVFAVRRCICYTLQGNLVVNEVLLLGIHYELVNSLRNRSWHVEIFVLRASCRNLCVSFLLFLSFLIFESLCKCLIKICLVNARPRNSSYWNDDRHQKLVLAIQIRPNRSPRFFLNIRRALLAL